MTCSNLSAQENRQGPGTLVGRPKTSTPTGKIKAPKDMQPQPQPHWLRGSISSKPPQGVSLTPLEGPPMGGRFPLGGDTTCSDP